MEQGDVNSTAVPPSSASVSTLAAPATMTDDQMQVMAQINEQLRITKSRVLFVYSAPKVGSTSLVSSLRLYCISTMDIIHIHDEVMLQVLAHIRGVRVIDIIQYNRFIGKDVYVFDVYRTPIERRISVFFEKIASLHFNTPPERLNEYSTDRVIKRFNNLFPHLGGEENEEDYFFTKYGLLVPPSLTNPYPAEGGPIPAHFDMERRYLAVKKKGVTYVKIRLADSDTHWSQIFASLLGIKIKFIRDYETSKKDIGSLYRRFYEDYRIPEEYFLAVTDQSSSFRYYLSQEEQAAYKAKWSARVLSSLSPSSFPDSQQQQKRLGYSKEMYAEYIQICLENESFTEIDCNHYKDYGCACKACMQKRAEVIRKLEAADVASTAAAMQQPPVPPSSSHGAAPPSKPPFRPSSVAAPIPATPKKRVTSAVPPTPCNTPSQQQQQQKRSKDTSDIRIEHTGGTAQQRAAAANRAIATAITAVASKTLSARRTAAQVASFNRFNGGIHPNFYGSTLTEHSKKSMSIGGRVVVK